jgi:apoptosis-inducing factor 2
VHTNYRRLDMRSAVAIIGGGYAGIAVAKGLDDVADVTLIDPRDTFVHNVAALRGVVDPAWTDRLFLPYGGLLRNGRVLRDRAVRVESGTIGLASGAELAADYIVLATGSTYPFPAKLHTVDSADGKAELRAAHAELVDADKVLLLGAGPVGLEFAGEIKAAWPDKAVTIVDPLEDILSGGYGDEFRTELRRQLDAMGVELVLGARLRAEPDAPVGKRQPITATTESGRELAADIWFRCYGVAPVSDYLGGDLATARQPTGHVAVTDELRVMGQERVFAIGDITNTPEGKTAWAAGKHAEVVVANLQAMIEGGDELTSYVPEPPAIVLPLGPQGGASHAPAMGGLLDAATTTQIKSAHLFVGHYAEILGVDLPVGA